MKWTYVLKQKTKVAVSLTIIIIMVLMTNFLSKRHFTELQQSLSSVYKDRLLVEVHIYKITTFLNEKNMLLHNMIEEGDSLQASSFEPINDSIAAHIREFGKTFLTPKEAEVFQKMKQNISELSQMETLFISQGLPENKHDLFIKFNKQHALLAQNLSQLSNIQSQEGQRLIEKSTKIVYSSKMALQLELVMVIVIGIIVQALIFSTKSTFSKISQKPNLN